LKALAELLAQAAALHPHLCPRQVLGVRMGMLAGKLLAVDLPQKDKRLFTIAETDGCFSDGVAVATNCWVGRRTLRVEDYGKVAATFVDSVTRQAVRLAPRAQARQLASEFAPEAESKWEAMLLGYQRMPDEALFQAQVVQLGLSIEKIISHPGNRTVCQTCGEEILNEREVTVAGRALCRACAGSPYYACAEGSHELPGKRAADQDIFSPTGQVFVP
jgi:formylmethanofuran dehydrogenase subunit E